jgi:polyisoprenoid-binding protein YceI
VKIGIILSVRFLYKREKIERVRFFRNSKHMIREEKMSLPKFAALAVTVIMLSFGAVAVAEKAVEWQIDPAHTTVGFNVKHLGITKVSGKFAKFSGEVKAEPETGKLVWVKGIVDVDSVDTGIAKRDGHLRSDDFFDVKVFPKMELVATGFTWDGDKISGKAKLTIKGITKEVDFKGEFLGIHKVDFGQGPNLRAGYTLEAEINRQDFGLKFNTIVEGVAVVSDTVKITLDAEIFRPLEVAK